MVTLTILYWFAPNSDGIVLKVSILMGAFDDLVKLSHRYRFYFACSAHCFHHAEPAAVALFEAPAEDWDGSTIGSNN